jgi:hypothetical protein
VNPTVLPPPCIVESLDTGAVLILLPHLLQQVYANADTTDEPAESEVPA